MNLRSLFPAKETPLPPEQYLAVEIHESLIKTAVWQKQGEDISIINIGSFESWDSEESLINGIDLSLTSATKNIDPPPEQVVLGLPDSWLEKDGKIHSSKTDLIKHLIKKLGLKPLGLLTTSQAIVHQIKNEEGIPPTAILLEVYLSKIVVSLVRLGTIEASEEVGRSGDISRDIEEALVRISSDKLPARFILTNGSNLEDEQQQITAYPWMDKLPFLHLPKVEVLPIDFSIKAVALIGGREIDQLNQQAGNLSEDSSSTPLSSTLSEEPISATNSLSDLGFTIDNNQDTTFEPTLDVINTPPSIAATDNIEDGIRPPEIPTTEPLSPPPSFLSHFRLPHFKPNIHLPKPPSISVPKLSFRGTKTIYLLLLPIILVVLTCLGYFSFASAEIVIRVAPKTFTQTLNPTISGDKKTLTASAEDSLATTGEATVGEKATGTVTIYNHTFQPISLKSGTKLVTNNLEFTLLSPVKIASATADVASTTYGNVSAIEVAASRIGAESNLPKNTQFIVDNQAKTILTAISDSDFQGGTSRTVKAVSKSDQDKLVQQITSKIKSRINDQVNQDNSDHQTLQLKDLTITKKEFDKSIGEEATSVSIKAEGQAEVLIYSRLALLDQVSQQLNQQIPADQMILPDKTQIDLSEPKPNDQGLTATAQIKAVLVSKVDTNQLARKSLGKSPDQLKSLYSNNIPGYQSTRVTIFPNLPILSHFTPLNPTKIHLSISTF